MSYWPALMPKDAIKPKIARLEAGRYVDERLIENCPSGNFEEKADATIQTVEKASTGITSV